MPVKPIPDGYHTVTPYLICKNAAKALEYYKQSLGAEELFRMETPDGQIGHAEIKIGDSPIMLADECPDMQFVAPQTLGGTPVSILLYVEDVDARFERAVTDDCEIIKPLQDQFYGDRSGTFKDPFGHVWTIATHVEDVPPDELDRRAKEMMEQHAGG